MYFQALGNLFPRLLWGTMDATGLQRLLWAVVPRHNEVWLKWNKNGDAQACNKGLLTKPTRVTPEPHAFPPIFFPVKCSLVFHRESGQQDGYGTWSLGAYNTAGKTGNYCGSRKSWEGLSGAMRVVTEGSPQQARPPVVLGNASQKTGCLPGRSKQGVRLCVTCIKCIHSVQIRKEARPRVVIIGQAVFYFVSHSVPLVPDSCALRRWKVKETVSVRAESAHTVQTAYIQGLPNSGLLPCRWPVTIHRLPGQCHSMLTALGASSRQPRGRVLSLGQ